MISRSENLTSKTKWKTEYGVSDTDSFMIVSINGREKFLEDKRNKKEIDYGIYDTKHKALKKRGRRNKDHYK